MNMRIKSITTDYDENEDRIRLAFVDDGENARLLWFTRRLGERLVSALIKGMQPQRLEQEAGPAKVQAAQVYAQLEARLSQKPAKPVRVDGDAAEGLVHEVNITMPNQGARLLVFRCKDLEPAELVMTQTELRQWLEVLHVVFLKAQWRNDIWPEWMESQRPTAI